MSQQGERSTGHEDDWWGQLYDDSTADTGPAAAADSLDDRFASAAGTVGQPAPRDTAGAPLPPTAPPSVPEQRAGGGPAAPARGSESPAAPARGADPPGGTPAPRRGGPERPTPQGEQGELTPQGKQGALGEPSVPADATPIRRDATSRPATPPLGNPRPPVRRAPRPSRPDGGPRGSARTRPRLPRPGKAASSR
ncbi:hypothetical protein SAV31267_075220 [Streptomyces avermitilis]|uniref:Uncharacterized protein n=1 Tax=Streptomyces avermitilis TaxID=33903 RepID=A0A4D4N487_STRAX|nr:hypothetical protein SAV31267_075220 [Streptomyces avermitilis]